MTMRVTPGEASRVAVLAVDEGILQVARYKNPDPLGYFFQKRMLEVETTQILDLILPEFKRFLALAAPGGDADGGFARHLNPFNRKRKPPVAYWSGVVDVGPGGRGLHATPCPTTSTASCASSRSRPARGASASTRSRDRSQGRLHPDAERAGDDGARRRVHRQRRRVQQHDRRHRPDPPRPRSRRRA